MVEVSQQPVKTVGHSGWVRVCHWLVALSFLILASTGFVILMCHPRLYWGEVGNDLTPALLDGHGGSPLDPRLTFDSFVIGRSNTLAHAAAKQVAMGRRDDPVMFNPLFVHAGVGLGKTHLLQAIAIKTNASGERAALYLTAERFMFGFASALRSQTALAFKDALRGIDVLVIDDLQFLQGKNSQAEFSHTLNSLLDGGRQVVGGGHYGVDFAAALAEGSRFAVQFHPEKSHTHGLQLLQNFASVSFEVAHDAQTRSAEVFALPAALAASPIRFARSRFASSALTKTSVSASWSALGAAAFGAVSSRTFCTIMLLNSWKSAATKRTRRPQRD